MPTFTVSPTGGNWSATTTWVGGVLPATGDDIVANATSGSLTVDSNRTCLTLNFTNYTNTFTINNGVTLTVAGTSIILGSGMIYTSGTTGVLNTNGNQAAITIAFNGITIPNLTTGRSGAGSTQTVTVSGTTPTVNNFLSSNTPSNSQIVLTGTSLNVRNSFTMGSTGALIGIAPNFVGTTTLSQTGSGSMSLGFTVTSGSTLILGGNINNISGNITFQTGSFLTPSTFTFTITANCNLDSSGVTWYNLNTTSNGHTITLLSDLNISNNLTWSAPNFGIAIQSVSVVRTITVQGSVTSTANYSRAFNLNNIILNLIGTGTFAVAWIAPAVATTCTININTTNPSGYVIGSSTFTGGSIMRLQTLNFNLSGTSVASAFSGTTIELYNNTNIDTNRSSVGGSNPIYGNINIFSGSNLITETTTNGNLNLTSATSSCGINGAKILFGGNLSLQAAVTAAGTSILEFTGGNNASWGGGAYQNDVIINKSSGATVQFLGNLTLGANGKSYVKTAGNINPNNFTVTNNGNITFNDFTFWNLTIPSSVITQNVRNTIQKDLTLASAGNVTFSGPAGWDCANLLCSTPNRIISLQSGSTYNTTTSVNMLGTDATRIVMSSSSLTTRAIWTLSPTATQSLVYVNGTRIDSSLGQTIWSFGATLNDTINWNLGTRPETAAHTFIY